MILTKDQENAIKIILERYGNGEKYTTLSGYAGSGKSTLISHAIGLLRDSGAVVAYAAFTGKAAEVLRKKGNKGACTLHKLLYDFVPRKDGTFMQIEKEDIEADIVVVDEVSMVPRSMVDLLLKKAEYVIFIGDNGQLPVLNINEENHLLEHPHIFLGEIVRQAQESEIIRLTMDIRAGKTLIPSKGAEVMILPKGELSSGLLLWGDEVIVATNQQRNFINSSVRGFLGYAGPPQDEERIICLKNYWSIPNFQGDVMVNGTTGIIKDSFEETKIVPRGFGVKKKKFEVYNCTFKLDDGFSYFENIPLDKSLLDTGTPTFTQEEMGKLKTNRRTFNVPPLEFAYAYAITCWKAQGSEWNKVVVLEENFPFDEVTHRRFLYTAATRAVEKLVIVKK